LVDPAEIELLVLSRQCLDRRVPDFEALATEAKAWEKRLYPSLQE
jgi:hypothetical protein